MHWKGYISFADFTCSLKAEGKAEVSLQVDNSQSEEGDLQSFLIEEGHDCEGGPGGVDKPEVLRRSHLSGPPDLRVVYLDPDHVAVRVVRLLGFLVAKARHVWTVEVLILRRLRDSSWGSAS